MNSPRVQLGSYPTPIEPLAVLGAAASRLWIKRDDLTSTLYGGNKVRKLEYILGAARAQGKTRLVTIGAVGSHHVLATTTFGARAGFSVTAVLLPQPRSEHATNNLRAGLAQGLDARAGGLFAAVPFHLTPALDHDAFFVQVGGSSLDGTLGYVAAARELAAQVRAGQMPEPDVLVVTVGSGGTAVGLAAGLELEGMRTRVVGILVAEPPWLLTRYARWLLKRTFEAIGKDAADDPNARLTFDAAYLGDGYGYPTEDGARATEIAKTAGIVLDPTYTAKTFAAALNMANEEKNGVVLYWHTLSSAPLAPLLEGAIAADALDPKLARLLR